MSQPGQSNYFGCNSNEFDRILKVFPVFGQIEHFFKGVASQLRGLQLDKKEISLFSALMVYTINHDCDSNLSNLIWTLNGKLCNVLTKYMQLRRNQHDSCETLLNLLVVFDKMTLKLRHDIGTTMIALANQSFPLENFHRTIFLEPHLKKLQNQY